MAFTTVTGKVTRTFYNGKGAEIAETFTAGGKEITKRWTAWFEGEHGLAEGQEVEVSGLHSDEVDEWEKEGQVRHSVKRSLNKARVKGGSSAPTAEPDVWGTSVPGSDSVPF